MLVERMGGVGVVFDRQLHADFDLRVGRLAVIVTWFCAARFERNSGP